MTQHFDRQDPGQSPVIATTERQPRGNFRPKQSPIGRLAADWGERVESPRFAARVVKPVAGPSELEKQSAVYETLNMLGGNADWREIARYIRSRWGFVLGEQEINALRARWGSLADTVMARPRTPPAEPATDVHHSPDR